MKLEILKENFKKGLSLVERVAGKNLSLPVLENVQIETEDSLLSLTCTDLEVAIKFWSLAKIIQKGKIIIPVKTLSNLISFFPNDKIILEQKKEGLTVECENFKNYIQGFNPEEFPLLPNFKNAQVLEVENKKVCQGISQVVNFASPSQTRPEISGVYFVFIKNLLKIVSTDSFRLAEKKISLSEEIEENFSFILPQKAAKEIVNIFSEKEGKVKIYILPNQILFESLMKETQKPEIHLISRLIEGEYPNYEEIIPQKFITSFIVRRDDFINQLKTASIFAGKINEVKLKIDPLHKKIEIFSQDPNLGESQSFLEAKIEGEKNTLSFNYKFLIEGLDNMKSSEIIFKISSLEGPSLIKPVGDESYTYIVMPIKSTV